MKIAAHVALIAVALTLVGLLPFCTPTPTASSADASSGASGASSTSSSQGAIVFDAPTAGDDWRRTVAGGDPTLSPTPNPSWYGQGPFRHSVAPGLLGASQSAPPPVFQASWSVSDWYVDPVAGNDTASCTSIGAPCKTYAQVAARWGTYSPRLRQTTTLHFLSTQADNTDPILFTPYAENGAVVIVKCELPTASQTGTLASVVSKNRATPQLLTATIGAGGIAGQMVVNSTHSSRAFLYTNPSGNAWTMTQPLAPLVPPFGYFSAGTEVDTWANTDAFSVYSLVGIYVSDFEVVQVSGNSSFGTPGYLWQCQNNNPGNGAMLQIGASITAVEESIQTNGISITSGPLSYPNIFVNAWAANTSLYGNISALAVNSGFSPEMSIRGGAVGLVAISPTEYRGDAILLFPGTIGGSSGLLGPLYLETGTTLGVTALSQVKGVVWGPGGLDIQGPARLSYPSGAGAAAANFLQTGGFKINAGTTACSHTGAAPDVISCGITISAANLDAAQSATAFGGNAFVLGGASISNGGL